MNVDKKLLVFLDTAYREFEKSGGFPNWVRRLFTSTPRALAKQVTLPPGLAGSKVIKPSWVNRLYNLFYRSPKAVGLFSKYEFKPDQARQALRAVRLAHGYGAQGVAAKAKNLLTKAMDAGLVPSKMVSGKKIPLPGLAFRPTSLKGKLLVGAIPPAAVAAAAIYGAKPLARAAYSVLPGAGLEEEKGPTAYKVPETKPEVPKSKGPKQEGPESKGPRPEGIKPKGPKKRETKPEDTEDTGVPVGYLLAAGVPLAILGYYLGKKLTEKEKKKKKEQHDVILSTASDLQRGLQFTDKLQELGLLLMGN